MIQKIKRLLESPSIEDAYLALELCRCYLSPQEIFSLGKISNRRRMNNFAVHYFTFNHKGDLYVVGIFSDAFATIMYGRTTTPPSFIKIGPYEYKEKRRETV